MLKLFSDYPFLWPSTNLEFCYITTQNSESRLFVYLAVFGRSDAVVHHNNRPVGDWTVTLFKLAAILVLEKRRQHFMCSSRGRSSVLTSTVAVMRASVATNNALVPLIMIILAGPALDKSAVTTDHTSARREWSQYGDGDRVEFHYTSY